MGPVPELPPPPGSTVNRPLLAYPLATTPLGRPAVGTAVPELDAGYLLVCGRGLLSLDLPSFPSPGLSTRFGVEWLPRLFEVLCLRVLSKSQCAQFFQCARNACDDFFLTFFCSPDCTVPLSVRASLVVTKWSVEPLDLALRKIPSLGGGIGLRCLEELADRTESLSMGGGGTSPSGLRLWCPFAVLTKSARPGISGIIR